MIILYSIIAVIVASLALYGFIKKYDEKWSRTDAGDVFGFALASIFIGIFWILTVWVALVKWAAEGKPPYWIGPLKVIYNFGKSKWQK